MGGEHREGKGRPVFYRERDPNGAVRITRLQPEGDPIESARGASEKTRGMKGVMDFQTEIQADRAWIKYRQAVGQQGQIPQDTHVFLVATRAGSLLVTFTHDASTHEENVRDEVAAFQRITDMILPL